MMQVDHSKDNIMAAHKISITSLENNKARNLSTQAKE